jgi:DNA-binding transcriptional LysR family regulator
MFALANAMLPKLVPELRRSLPKVELDFVELSASTRETRLLDHSVTVALCMPAIRHSEIEAATIGAQRLMLALPARSSLARSAAVQVSRLQGRPLVSLPPPAQEPASSVVASLLRRHQVSMPVVSRVETVHSALNLVLAGEGLAILPACAEIGCPTGVVFRPFLDADDALDVAVCWRRDSLNPLVRNFLTCAEKVIRQI